MIRAMRHVLLAATASLSLITVLHSQAPPSGRPLTIQDYYRVRNVGSPSISPNGRWVAFAVTTRVEDDKDANKSAGEGWIVPLDWSAAAARIDPEGGEVTSLRWLPDGRLQYTRDRQAWAMDPANPSGGATTVDAPEGGGRGRGRGGAAPSTTPSPDGKWLAELRDLPRPASERRYADDFEKRHQERFQGAIFDWKDFQRDGQPFPAPDPRARPGQQIVLRPAGSGESRVLSAADIRPAGLSWHPAGSMIAFTADPDWRDELKYESADLWTVSTDGAVTRVTNDSYAYSEPRFSPDGAYLSYVRTFGTDMIIQQKLNHGGPRDLYVRPTAGGEPINLTAKWDLEPGPAQWAPDGRFIYFTAATGGENHLFRTSVPGGVVEQVTKGPRRLTALEFNPAFTRMVYSVGVHDAPADLYSANIDGSDERRLTTMNAAVTKEIAFSKAERLTWASNDGTRIEGWLMFPHGYDPGRGPYPLIVTSHGGPH